MKYIYCIISDILANILAYIFNPIVCLFADEYGNLPYWLYLFQTYDNPLDIDWMVYEGVVPKVFRYDFNKHYVYHEEQKLSDGTAIAGYVDLIDPEFTIKEKIQRYFCRLSWLYRNTAYGFSYYLNGVAVNAADVIVKTSIKEKNNERFIGYIPNTGIWCVFLCVKYCKWFRYRVYMGWKLKSLKSGRHMIVLSFNPFKSLE